MIEQKLHGHTAGSAPARLGGAHPAPALRGVAATALRNTCQSGE